MDEAYSTYGRYEKCLRTFSRKIHDKRPLCWGPGIVGRKNKMNLKETGYG